MEIFPLRKSGLESGLKSGLTESGVLPPGSSAALVLQAFFMAFTSPFL
jgi:hypothetical protein